VHFAGLSAAIIRLSSAGHGALTLSYKPGSSRMHPTYGKCIREQQIQQGRAGVHGAYYNVRAVCTTLARTSGTASDSSSAIRRGRR